MDDVLISGDIARRRPVPKAFNVLNIFQITVNNDDITEIPRGNEGS